MEGGIAPHGTAQQHRALGHRPVPQKGALLQHRVGADQAALPHRDPLADPAGGHQGAALGQRGGAPHPGADLGQQQIQLDLAVQGVGGGLEIGARVPHVPPVAVGGVAVEGRPLLQQGREQLPGEVIGGVRRDALQHRGGEEVDAGVDQVGEHLSPARLLQKPLHPSPLAQLHQAVLQGVPLPVEQQGGRPAPGPVAGIAVPQVEVADAVPGEHQEVLLPQERLRLPDPAGGAHGLPLHKIVQLHPPGGAVPEVVLNHLGQIAQGDGHLVKPVFAQQQQNMLQHRPPEDGHHGLGALQRQRPQPGPLPARQDHSFHPAHPFVEMSGISIMVGQEKNIPFKIREPVRLSDTLSSVQK